MQLKTLDRTKNASRNIVWGMLNLLISILLPFLTRTVMIYTMGMQYVGLGSLFTSILQVLSFAELGVGGALVFSMYKPIADGEDEKVCALLLFYRKTYRVIGVVILTLGLVILPFIDMLIAGDVPDGINIYVLFLIYLINSVLGYFLFAYKQSLLTASQRVDLISKIGMLVQLVSGILQITVLVVAHNYYAYALVVPFITCVNNICVGRLTDKLYPKYKCTGKIERDEMKQIKKKVGGMVFQKIGGIVLSSVDTIVISAFLGLTSLALYQNYYYIVAAGFGLLGVILQSVISSIGNSVATESVEKNYMDFKKFNFIYIWIVSWCAVCLLCLYQPFMQLWVGKEHMFESEMVVLFVVYFFVHKWCDMLYIYQEACGIWWETKFVPLFAAGVNLVVNIVLVQMTGLPGILISTIVAVVFIYDMGYAKVIFKTYFKSVKKGLIRYWRKQLYYLAVVPIAAVCTKMVCDLLPATNPGLQLIFNAFVCIALPNLIFAIAWFKLPEFKLAVNMAKGMIGRRLN